MPSVAKKLVIVQNNDAAAPEPPAPQAARPEELRLLEALLFAAGHRSTRRRWRAGCPTAST